MQETWVQSLGWEDPLEKGKATHTSILTWRIPWTVWPPGLQRVGHDSDFHVSVIYSKRFERDSIFIRNMFNFFRICL